MTTNPLKQRARELAQWVHEKLCCAQNLPWEEGDICDDCLESAKTELIPMLTSVQAEARERLAAWMIEHSFSTGHGDTFEDLLKELDWQVKELRQKARDATLEYVAMWLEANHRDDDDEQWEACCNLPEKIRALAQALQPEEKEGK